MLETYQSSFHCRAGVELEVSKRWQGVAVQFKPVSECYKPLTYSDMREVIEIRERENDAKR